MNSESTEILNILTVAHSIQVRGEDLWPKVARMVNMLIYTAYAESKCQLRSDRFTMLLSIELNPPRADIEVSCHALPFMRQIAELIGLLIEGKAQEVDERVSAASTVVHRTRTSLAQGKLIPYEELSRHRNYL